MDGKTHDCEQKGTPERDLYGDAITRIDWDEEKKLWFASNDEYATSINYCPWCGKKLE